MGDPGEVNAGDGGEEAEDDELEGRVGGLEGVVQPAAEGVVPGAGAGLPEEVGDLGGNLLIMEERVGGVIRRGDVGRDGLYDGQQRLDGQMGSGNGGRDGGGGGGGWGGGCNRGGGCSGSGGFGGGGGRGLRIHLLAVDLLILGGRLVSERWISSVSLRLEGSILKRKGSQIRRELRILHLMATDWFAPNGFGPSSMSNQ